MTEKCAIGTRPSQSILTVLFDGSRLSSYARSSTIQPESHFGSKGCRLLAMFFARSRITIWSGSAGIDPTTDLESFEHVFWPNKAFVQSSPQAQDTMQLIGCPGQNREDLQYWHQLARPNLSLCSLYLLYGMISLLLLARLGTHPINFPPIH